MLQSADWSCWLLDIHSLWDGELRLPDLSAYGPIKENPEGKVKKPDWYCREFLQRLLSLPEKLHIYFLSPCSPRRTKHSSCSSYSNEMRMAIKTATVEMATLAKCLLCARH